MARRHVLVVPYPAQGHVMPLMKLSHNLVEHGFKVTFVNSELNHTRVMTAVSKVENTGDCSESICLVSLPNGMGPGGDRNQLGKQSDSIAKVMPAYLEELITKINNEEEEKITFLIADFSMGWALEVADKFSIGRAAFWPASAQLLVESLHIPKLVDDGVFTTDGTLMKAEMILISPTMPATNPAHFPWLCMGDINIQKSIFNLMLNYSRVMLHAQYIFCNSFYELEPSAFAMIPNVQPIGPLNASSQLGHFWPQDLTCLSWLHQQAPRSVIYVAFGSIAILNKQQFDELALGLELSGQPFLWVVRPGLTTNGQAYPEGFEARVGSRGRMVGWAPQKEVLAHPSIACFITHCGWNSIMEGLTHGIPFLCWPYFADQFANQRYICHTWDVGFSFTADENGIISREEIYEKLALLLGDEKIRHRSLYFKQIARNNVGNGGASLKNFEEFAKAIKD